MALKSTITTPAVVDGVTQVNSQGDTIIAVPVVLVNENGEFSSFSSGGGGGTADLTETNNRLGATNSIAATEDIGNWNLNSLFKRFNLKFTNLLSLFPSSLGAKTSSNSFSITPATNAIFTVANTVLVDGSSVTQPVYSTNSSVLGSYEIADLDEGTISYYGYIATDGKWFIKQITSTTIRFCKGSTGYITAWSNRSSQVYQYFNDVF